MNHSMLFRENSRAAERTEFTLTSGSISGVSYVERKFEVGMEKGSSLFDDFYAVSGDALRNLTIDSGEWYTRPEHDSRAEPGTVRAILGRGRG